jgi:hypothetical protein
MKRSPSNFFCKDDNFFYFFIQLGKYTVQIFPFEEKVAVTVEIIYCSPKPNSRLD